MKRRDLILALGLAPVVSAVVSRPAHSGQKSDSEPDGTVIVDLLFVQSAHKVTLADNVLTLEGVSPATIFFSDRPERITGHEPTEDFVAEWAEGDDSFASNPPNATLSILVGPEPQEIVMVLKSPKLNKHVLTYQVEILDGASEASGDAASLFIDTLGHPLSPGSVAGVHRRHRRRRRRRVRRATPGPGL
jgi:hypothetical protein